MADPHDAELIRAPDRQLQELACRGYLVGDCDDAATLGAALLYSLGIPAQFVVIRMPWEEDFSHVFLRCGSLDIDPIAPPELLPIRGYAEMLEFAV